MGNDIFYNHLTGFADLKLDTTSSPHRLLGRLAGGDYFVIGADGKDGANQYLYIAYADDEFGTNFSTTKPSSYISFYQSTTPASNLTASMFTEWKKYVGKDGTSGKSVYVGYAQSQAGNGFSFTAGREHPFVAFITSDKPQEEITAADFAGANFVRFHDSGWNNISLNDLTDVATANESGGTVLMYDESESAWRAVRLADVCYSGNYEDLIGTPTPYTFNSTMFQEDPDTHEISIVSDYVQASLGINSYPQDSASNYFLNQNGDWVEITEGGGSGGDPGGSTAYQFNYPLSESNGYVYLMMNNSDTDAASVGWVLSQGYISYISSEMIDPILLINREYGSSSRVLAENGTWVDLPQNGGGGESPAYTFQSPLQESGGNVTLDTSGFLLTGVLDGYALKTDIPTKVSELENDSAFITVSALSGYALTTDIPTVPTKVSELENDVGYLTEVTKESVDTALGISESGSADKYLNEQGQFVEIESSGTGATALKDLTDVDITESSAERQLLTGDGTTWSNSLEVVDTFNYTKEVPYPTKFTFSTNGLIAVMILQTSGEYAGKYVDVYENFIIYDVVWDAEAKQISSLTFFDRDSTGVVFLLELVDGSTHEYFGYIIDGSMSQSTSADIRNVVTTMTNYSPDTVPTLAGVKDVFDTDYFDVEDGKRVSPKAATYTKKGVVSFNAEHFMVDESGYVSLNTRYVTSTNDIPTVDFVKEWKTYTDGSWYRLWASGWLEQGGRIVSTAPASATVSFPLEFANDGYDLQYTISRTSLTGTTSAQLRYYAVSALTTTSFTVYAIVSADQGHKWYACGWAA